MEKEKQKFVIGVDGGGSKTAAVLADSSGKILVKAEGGSANPRDIGLENAVGNVVFAIKKILPKKKKIAAAFMGLPAVEEEFKFKKEIIRKEFLKHKEMTEVFKGEVVIGSDQLSGFRSGIDGKDGVMLNAASGSVAHGWRGKKEVKIDGWGYLSETGSAFWIGQRALQSVWKDIDGRQPKTLITKLVFQRLKIKDGKTLIDKIYSNNPQDMVRSFSILVDEAAGRKDKTAKEILIEAAGELALSANTAIKKLNFQTEKFPLVLIGSVFNSKLVMKETKRQIKKFAPEVRFIRPEKEPVFGAVKLAVEELKR